jgi:lipopolysaccharide export system protein LptC
MPEPRAARAPGSDPDYFLKEFSIKTFDAQGRLRSELSGQAGRHFPDVDVIEVDQPRIRAYNLRGEPTVATAKRALSNADGTQVQLIGDAIVVREATGKGPSARQRLEVRSEFLHVYADTERLQTDRPVQIVRGPDRFSGERLEFSNLDQQIQLQGRVRGQIAGRRP